MTGDICTLHTIYMLSAVHTPCIMHPYALHITCLHTPHVAYLCAWYFVHLRISQIIWLIVSCQKFVRFYLFFSLRTLFFPQTLILLKHVLTFAMISPHVCSPLFHFAFTIHTKTKPLRTSAKSIWKIYQRHTGGKDTWDQ